MDKLDVTLLTFIKKAPTSAEIENVGRQICDCLNILDEEGILHRDFNLNNIMLKRQPDNTLRVYIIDFGLSYDKRDKSSVTSFLTPLGEISQLRFYKDNIEHDQNYVWFKTQTMTAFKEELNRGFEQFEKFTELFRMLSDLHGDETNWYVI
jgi:serine/threonine protein kinase